MGGLQVALIKKDLDLKYFFINTKTHTGKFIKQTDCVAQKFISNSFGKSYRVLAIKNDIVAAHQFVGEKNEFRSNVGSDELDKKISTEKFNQLKEFLTLHNVANKMNIDYAGYDILEDNGKFYIIEINVNPAIDYSFINPNLPYEIAVKMIDYAIDKVIENKK